MTIDKFRDALDALVAEARGSNALRSVAQVLDDALVATQGELARQEHEATRDTPREPGREGGESA
jgi:hypothetical protein